MAIKVVKIKILSACYQGGKACKKGDVIEVAENIARECIWLKRAELIVDKKEASAPVEGAAAETGGEKGNANKNKKGKE